MDKNILDKALVAVEKAKEELNKACYLEDCGNNAGIRKINANKTEWLKWLIYFAERGLAYEKFLVEQTEEVNKEDEDSDLIPYNCKECATTTELNKLIIAKDAIIKDLTDKLSSLHLTYDCEVEYRKALATRAKIDHFTEVLRIAHERCWLDGTVLVTPVEYLDRCLLELIKE